MFIKINKKILLIIALLIPLGLFSNNTTEADAWGWYAHQSLPVVAAGFLKNTIDLGEFGDRWADLFQIYESDLKLGGTYPDRVLGDSSNHVYHVLENVQMFKKTPDVVRLRYEAFKNKLITGNYSGAVFEAGVMSHYVTDICNPMHTAGAATSPKEGDSNGPGGVNPHRKYEQDANIKIDSIVFNNYTPVLLSIPLEDTVIECATYSNQYYLDLVEIYWNGSFWTPWVEEMTTDVMNFAVRQLSNIIFTAIKEVNITLPDFTPLKINIEIKFPNEIQVGQKNTGLISVTDWKGNPLDVDLKVSRIYISYTEDNNSDDGFIENEIGPFLVLSSRESLGTYSFDITLGVSGSYYIEVEVSKTNMISNKQIFKFLVNENVLTSSTTSENNITLSTTSENPPTTSFSLLFFTIGIFVLIIFKKSRQNR